MLCSLCAIMLYHVFVIVVCLAGKQDATKHAVNMQLICARNSIFFLIFSLFSTTDDAGEAKVQEQIQLPQDAE